MLWQSNRGILVASEYVEFYMDDGETVEGIRCRVSREALDDRIARERGRSSGELRPLFNWFRTEIEQVAATKHERAQIESGGYVLVATADLN